MAIEKFPFLAVSKNSEVNKQSTVGSLGLAIKAENDSALFIDQLHSEGHISKRQFSLAFNRSAHPKGHNNGQITFGGPPANMKQSLMNCHKVVAPQT